MKKKTKKKLIFVFWKKVKQYLILKKCLFEKNKLQKQTLPFPIFENNLWEKRLDLMALRCKVEQYILSIFAEYYAFGHKLHNHKDYLSHLQKKIVEP